MTKINCVIVDMLGIFIVFIQKVMNVNVLIQVLTENHAGMSKLGNKRYCFRDSEIRLIVYVDFFYFHAADSSNLLQVK